MSEEGSSTLEAALAQAELLSPELLERAKRVGRETRTPLIASLTRLGLMREEDLAHWLAEETGVARWALGDGHGIPALPADANMTFLKAKPALFIEADGSKWRLVVTDPTDESLIAALKFTVNKPADILIGTEADILSALSQLSDDEDQQGLSVAAAIEVIGSASESDDISALQDLNSDAPAIRAVNKIISDAVEQHASDIHIEPLERSVVVRYRSDGMLREILSLGQGMASALVSRIKVMAKLDIAEKRLPQDGRIRTSIRGQNVDLRVSTSPTIYGESVVLRILGRSTTPLDLTELGLPDLSVQHMQKALARPNGIILVTGPTGSGKTTTLYAALNKLHTPDTKILTVEDPIEYLMPGINQVQVKPDIGLTYAKALRSFLRQDPDVMMVGEIRDKETADIAIRAALTGHLVLSTLHTNSALGAITRLVDMGIEPFLIANTLVLSVGQRLVRQRCGQCKIKRAPRHAEQQVFESHMGLVPNFVFDKGGCPACQQTGFSGRIPIIETTPIDDQLAHIITQTASEAQMNSYAQEQGYKSLFADGLSRVANGLTTISEVERAALGTAQ
ncbi:MAG: GspE/PulE family protein [Sphingomonadales bacterium]